MKLAYIVPAIYISYAIYINNECYENKCYSLAEAILIAKMQKNSLDKNNCNITIARYDSSGRTTYFEVAKEI